MRQRLLIVLFVQLASALPIAAQPSAFALLAEMRQAYAELSSYQDRGLIEKRAPGEPAVVLFFETRASREVFRWQVDHDTRHKVFWRDAAGSGVYDSGLEQVLLPKALITELIDAFGAGSLDALVVPATLLGADEPLSDPEGAVVEGPEPCAETSCWVLSLSRMGGTIESTWWVEEKRHLIRKIEVRAASPDGLARPTTWLVEHGELRVGTTFDRQELGFVPPESARRVVAWDTASANDEDASLALGFFDEITVDNATIVARVVDGLDNAIFGLQREDFVARIKGQEIPVTAVDWISPYEASPLPVSTEDAAEPRVELTPLTLPTASGRLIVLFVQADFNAVRIRGHLRLRHYVEEDFLPFLHPDDWVAVLTYDSHLKLWHDFTRDHEGIAEVLHHAIRFGGAALARRNRRGPSLFEAFDAERGRQAATPEQALHLLGETLAKLPGDKEVVYLGWGLGRFDFSGVRMTAEYFPAVRALVKARATVFVLDVTDADIHDLEVGVQRLAGDTGGIYQKTQSAQLAVLATRRLAAVMRGHYQLTLDVSGAPEGAIKISLRKRKGRVIYVPRRVER